jgi:hypothetical protein
VEETVVVRVEETVVVTVEETLVVGGWWRPRW